MGRFFPAGLCRCNVNSNSNRLFADLENRFEFPTVSVDQCERRAVLDRMRQIYLLKLSRYDIAHD
jgi:hypothetical protein